MIATSSNGSNGYLAIVDASRDIRSNVEDTVASFSISGYSSGQPTTIFNFPSELTGYVYSSSDGSLVKINYTTEATAGNQGTFQAGQNSIAVPPTFSRIYAAEQNAGTLEIIDFLVPSGTYFLNIPNVDKVVTNTGDTVTLVMVRNSNTVYRIFKLNLAQYPTSEAAMSATGAVDCEPQLNPVYCAVAVPGTFNRPANVYYSLDGTTAYVLNCAQECGGTTDSTPSGGVVPNTVPSVTLLQQGPLNNNVIPTSPTQPNPQIANVPVPGGATVALSDGSTLYIAGQQLQSGDGLFEGFLSTMNQATNTITGKYPISDGTHTKMLFADNNTLWIGSQYCATGERQAHGLNYNCLTMVPLGAATLSPQIVPNVTPGNTSTTVAYPNQDDNLWYYGSLTGLCWVQTAGRSTSSPPSTAPRSTTRSSPSQAPRSTWPTWTR
jgi:hypothetical protein